MTNAFASPYHKIKSQYITTCYMFLRLDKALKYLANDNSIFNNCNREINTKHIILHCMKYEKVRKELNEKNESHLSNI